MACAGGDATTCAGGQGTCQDNSTICRCLNDGFVDSADFRQTTNCEVNTSAIKTLWTIHGVVWAGCIPLSIMAMAIMRRKTPKSYRIDFTTAILVFLSAVFGVALAALELVASERIAVDINVTVMFALHHFFAWVLLILKPVARSEYSISGFAIQRTPLTMKSYTRVFPLLVIVVCLAEVWPILSALRHDLERPMLIAFLVSDVLVTTIMGIISWSSIRIATKEFNRAMANPSVSRRASLSHRIQVFFRNAQRIMFLATFTVTALDALLLLFVFCENCTPYLWMVLSIFLAFCGLWFGRNMFVSCQMSWRNRSHDVSTHHSRDKQQVLSSKEQTVVNGPMSPNAPHKKPSDDSTSLGQSKSASVGASKTRANRPRKKKKATTWKLKNMSAVQEGEYEGTVVMTHVEGLSPFGASRISVHDQDIGEGDTLEESVDRSLGTHQEQEHEMSSLTEGGNKGSSG